MNTKKVQVVILPKELREHGNILKWTGNGGFKKDSLAIYNKSDHIPSGYWKAQHLYFISDDEIKEGDWYYDYAVYVGVERILKCDRHDKECANHNIGCNTKDVLICGKIIASTDPSLGLPAIPEEWVRTKYVPSNGSIKGVELEMEKTAEAQEKWSMGWEYTPAKYKLKLYNNEVVIVDEPTLQELGTDLWKKADAAMYSVDQELEDAAKGYESRNWNAFKNTNALAYSAFKAGADWREKHPKQY